MDIVLRPWRHCFDFEGRSRRTEFALFHLVNLVVFVALLIAGGALVGSFQP